MKRVLGFSFAVAVAIGLSSQAKSAEYCGPGSPPQVGYNYYVPGVPCGEAGAIGAQLYTSPRPVPPHVGHTFITYEGLMPHEFLYHHKNIYKRYWGPYGGTTTAKIRYR